MVALDMVGVVGSSPIAPTKQNPLCWAVWKGSPKGGPFFVVCDLQNFLINTPAAIVMLLPVVLLLFCKLIECRLGVHHSFRVLERPPV